MHRKFLLNSPAQIRACMQKLLRHRNGTGHQRKRKRVLVPIGERGLTVYSQLLEALSQARMPFFVGGSTSPHSRQIHIHKENLSRFLQLATSVACNVNIKVYVQDLLTRKYRRIAEFDPFAPRESALDLVVAERSVDTSTPILDYVSRIHINCWTDVQHYSEEDLCGSQRRNSLYGRIRRSHLDTLSNGSDIDAEIRSTVSHAFDIDAVITWVDDQDPEWLASKNRRAAGLGRKVTRALDEERFRNRDELRYCLRSIEQFAPFFRRIYLVTAGQVPAWLDTTNPQIRLVNHEDIYSHKEFLPTFNSSGIETQLHHIEGLAEHFVYFNDDFFLGQLCTPQDFFLENGIIKYFPSAQRAAVADIDDSREEYLVADRNASELITSLFGRCNREIMSHCPYPSSRSLLQELEAQFQAHFDACAAEPFRSSRDLRPIAFMQYHYGFLVKRAIPSHIPHGYFALWKPHLKEMLEEQAFSRQHKTLCLNDVGVAPSQVAATSLLARDFLENYFPIRSRFEKY
jgi:hypothetical protein